MKKILCIIQPFDLKQTLYIYQNGNKLEKIEPKTEELPKLIINLSNKYNINNINFLGSKNYSKGIVEQIQEIELTLYNEKKLNFNYI